MKTLLKKLILFFKTDNTTLQAASLSFFTLFAMIPSLQLIFYALHKINVLTSMQIQVQNFLFNILIPTQQTAIHSQLSLFLQNSESLGSNGIFYMFITALLFYFNFDQIVHNIFKTEAYTIKQKARNFFILIILTPLLLLCALFLTPQITQTIEILGIHNIIASQGIIAFIVIFMLFLINYWVTPNMAFEKRYVFLSAFIAALTWEIAKLLFIYYISINSTYITLYGSLSVILIFFLWVYFSWMIFLYGMKGMLYLHTKNRANYQKVFTR
jgi:membrane protein